MYAQVRGGRFPGGAIIHWAAGADGAGALFTGDTIIVTPGEGRVTSVWSAPNRIPLPVHPVPARRGGRRLDRIGGRLSSGIGE
jgi:hypothetical protein